MTQRILIMGLPGSGKTTLAGALKKYLEEHGDMSYGRASNEFIGDYGCKVTWLNADDIRRKYNDWDFSHEGRIRQSKRMRNLADDANADYAICDFVAPLVEMREIFQADFTIWMDTIVQGRFADTNSVFDQPLKFDLRIQDFNYNIDEICQFVLNSQKAK